MSAADGLPEIFDGLRATRDVDTNLKALKDLRKLLRKADDKTAAIEALRSAGGGWPDLWRVWEGHAAVKSVAVVQEMYLLVRDILDAHKDCPTALADEVRELGMEVARNQLRRLYHHLNASDHHSPANAALLLLASLARLGSEPANLLVSAFDFSLPCLPRLATLPRGKKGGEEAALLQYHRHWSFRDVSRRPNRACFVEFALALLAVPDRMLRLVVLQIPPVVGGLLNELGRDPPAVAVDILQVLTLWVLRPQAGIPSTIQGRILSSRVLQQIADVAQGRLDAELEDGTTVSQLALDLLRRLTNDPQHGVAQPASEARDHPGPDGGPGFQKLLGLAQHLKLSSCRGHRALLKAMVAGRPQLAAAVLGLAGLRVLEEPQPSAAWLVAADSALHLLAAAAPCAAALTQRATAAAAAAPAQRGMRPPSWDAAAVRGLLQHLLPPALSKTALSKAVQHNDRRVRRAALLLLYAILDALQPALTAVRDAAAARAASTGGSSPENERQLTPHSRQPGAEQPKEPWRAFQDRLQAAVRRKLPDLQALLPLAHADPEALDSPPGTPGTALQISNGAREGDGDAEEGTRAPGEDTGGDVVQEVGLESDSVERRHRDSSLAALALEVLARYLAALPEAAADARLVPLRLLPAQAAELPLQQQAAALKLLQAGLDNDVCRAATLHHVAASSSSLQPLLSLMAGSGSSAVQQSAQLHLQAVLAASGLFPADSLEPHLWIAQLPAPQPHAPTVLTSQRGFHAASAKLLLDCLTTVLRHPVESYELARHLAAGDGGGAGACPLPLSALALQMLKECLRMMRSSQIPSTDRAAVCSYVSGGIATLLQQQQQPMTSGPAVLRLLQEEATAYAASVHLRRAASAPAPEPVPLPEEAAPARALARLTWRLMDLHRHRQLLDQEPPPGPQPRKRRRTKNAVDCLRDHDGPGWYRPGESGGAVVVEGVAAGFDLAVEGCAAAAEKVPCWGLVVEQLHSAAATGGRSLASGKLLAEKLVEAAEGHLLVAAVSAAGCFASDRDDDAATCGREDSASASALLLSWMHLTRVIQDSDTADAAAGALAKPLKLLQQAANLPSASMASHPATAALLGCNRHADHLPRTVEAVLDMLPGPLPPTPGLSNAVESALGMLERALPGTDGPDVRDHAGPPLAAAMRAVLGSLPALQQDRSLIARAQDLAFAILRPAMPEAAKRCRLQSGTAARTRSLGLQRFALQLAFSLLLLTSPSSPAEHIRELMQAAVDSAVRLLLQRGRGTAVVPDGDSVREAAERFLAQLLGMRCEDDRCSDAAASVMQKLPQELPLKASAPFQDHATAEQLLLGCMHWPSELSGTITATSLSVSAACRYHFPAALQAALQADPPPGMEAAALRRTALALVLPAACRYLQYCTTDPDGVSGSGAETVLGAYEEPLLRYITSRPPPSARVESASGAKVPEGDRARRKVEGMRRALRRYAVPMLRACMVLERKRGQGRLSGVGEAERRELGVLTERAMPAKGWFRPSAAEQDEPCSSGARIFPSSCEQAEFAVALFQHIAASAVPATPDQDPQQPSLHHAALHKLVACSCATLARLWRMQLPPAAANLAGLVQDALDGTIGDALAELPSPQRASPWFRDSCHHVLQLGAAAVRYRMQDARAIRTMRRLLAALVPEDAEVGLPAGAQDSSAGIGGELAPQLGEATEKLQADVDLSAAARQLFDSLLQQPHFAASLASPSGAQLLEAAVQLPLPLSTLLPLVEVRGRSSEAPSAAALGSLKQELVVLTDVLLDLESCSLDQEAAPWGFVGRQQRLLELLLLLLSSYEATMSPEDCAILQLMLLVERSLTQQPPPHADLEAAPGDVPDGSGAAWDTSREVDLEGEEEEEEEAEMEAVGRLSGPLAAAGFLWGNTAKAALEQRVLLPYASTRGQTPVTPEAAEQLPDVVATRTLILAEHAPIEARRCALTVAHFPDSRTLSGEWTSPADPDGGTGPNRGPGPPVVPSVYDPAWLLPFAVDVLRHRVMDAQQFALCGLLSVVLRALAVQDSALRCVAFQAAALFHDALSASDEWRAKTQLSTLMAAVRNAVPEPFHRLPTHAALFAAEAALVVQHPAEAMFGSANKWLLRGAALNTTDVPLLASALLGGSAGWVQDRHWCLQLIAGGICCEADLKLLRNSYVLEHLVALHDGAASPEIGHTRHLVLDVLRRAAGVRGRSAAAALAGTGLLSWIGRGVDVQACAAVQQCSSRDEAGRAAAEETLAAALQLPCQPSLSITSTAASIISHILDHPAHIPDALLRCCALLEVLTTAASNPWLWHGRYCGTTTESLSLAWTPLIRALVRLSASCGFSVETAPLHPGPLLVAEDAVLEDRDGCDRKVPVVRLLLQLLWFAVLAVVLEMLEKVVPDGRQPAAVASTAASACRRVAPALRSSALWSQVCCAVSAVSEPRWPSALPQESHRSPSAAAAGSGLVAPTSAAFQLQMIPLRCIELLEKVGLAADA